MIPPQKSSDRVYGDDSDCDGAEAAVVVVVVVPGENAATMRCAIDVDGPRYGSAMPFELRMRKRIFPDDAAVYRCCAPFAAAAAKRRTQRTRCS